MDDLMRQGVAILRGMWQRRWIGLIVAWVVAIGGAIAVLRIPDRYEASARIHVNTQSVLKPLMAGIAVQPNIDQQIQMLSRTLISRPNVEKLVRMADLDLGAKSKQEQDALVDNLIGTLKIQSAGRDNLYTLAYRDSRPDQAKRVVQSLVQIFVESGLGGQRKDTDSAKKFIDEQIKIYEQKLEEAETRLKEFKLRNIEIAAAEGKDHFGRMSEVSALLAQARLDLREAENSRDAMRKQSVDDEPSLIPDKPDAMSTVATPQIDARIATLRGNLDTMLLRFTEEHPDVVTTKRLIANLEEQKKQEIATRMRAAAANPAKGGGVAGGNPFAQQLKIAQAREEANVASLKTRVAAYEARVARLKEAAKLAPQLEAEYTQLNRDYGIHKRNYENLVSRRESVEISGEMETSAGVADFRLIDPPRVSPQPVAPNRMLLFP